jgi:hypothetical protein
MNIVKLLGITSVMTMTVASSAFANYSCIVVQTHETKAIGSVKMQSKPTSTPGTMSSMLVSIVKEFPYENRPQRINKEEICNQEAAARNANTLAPRAPAPVTRTPVTPPPVSGGSSGSITPVNTNGAPCYVMVRSGNSFIPDWGNMRNGVCIY